MGSNAAPPTPADGELPDCLECGTCCFSHLPTYVRVTGADYERLGDAAESLTFFEGNRCFLRLAADRCVALVIDAAGGRFVCSVYGARPGTCRDLERGSPACLGERATKGERPRAALTAAREARE